jgi:hypothetical protein
MGNLVPLQVQTQQGELTINLNLTIKLDSDGKASLMTVEANDPKNVKYEMPQMEDNTYLLLDNFGKEVKK